MRLTKLAFVLALLAIAFLAPGQARALAFQDPQPESSAPPPQDPISQLRLTPEQRQKIRAIREENKEERAMISQRLRESNLALEQALDVDNPNEMEIEQRLKDVAAAQAASTRIRVITELKIRRVLTPEQIGMWRTLRQAAGRRTQTIDGQRRQGPPGARPNQPNGIPPLFQRRNQLPRNPRP